MTGLVNSVVNAATLAPTSAVVQVALFADDTTRQIADLERRLVESEGAYSRLCDDYEALDRAYHHLLAENHTLRVGLDAARRATAVCALGVVRR